MTPTLSTGASASCDAQEPGTDVRCLGLPCHSGDHGNPHRGRTWPRRAVADGADGARCGRCQQCGAEPVTGPGTGPRHRGRLPRRARRRGAPEPGRRGSLRDLATDAAEGVAEVGAGAVARFLRAFLD